MNSNALCWFSAILISSLWGTVSGLVAAEQSSGGLSAYEQRTGWRSLFDGRTTDGWRNYKSDSVHRGWQVRDGVLTRQERGAGDLITREQFGSFELQLEYAISPEGNSGVMFHVTEEGGRPWHTGPEIQIQDNDKGHDPQKAGWLYQLYKPVKPEWAVRFENQVGFKSPDVSDATRPAGQWNHLYLRVTPTDGEVCLNGVSYYRFVKGSEDWNQRVAASKFAKMPLFGKAEKGHICLQDHGDVVSYRNIRVRELPEDGKLPEPVDGTLPLRAEVAFPEVKWEGWSPVDENGKPNAPLRPIQITHAGDGSQRIFVIDQSGMIHVLPNDRSARKARLFADLRDRVHPFTKDDEEGLLGFAFHPKFADNGQFFVYYNTVKKPRTIYLSRFHLAEGEPQHADPDSEEILMTISQPFANHNGGPMAFGPDGCLYIGMGDGGGRNDPMGLGQATDSLMGSILRIDVDHPSEGRGYGIPADNPFVGKKGYAPELYATGIRNPWRLSFDRETGNLWIADVGQDLWEEIDIIKAGGNYGWSRREGTAAFGSEPLPEEVTTVDPVWEYDHRVGKSITGGHVYRGKKLPQLTGHYLYGDYITGRLWALQYDESTGKVVRNMSIPWNGLPVLAFGEDESGESYVTTPSQNGRGIYRIVADR